MSHVFISYSHQNKDKLDSLLSLLKANGFNDTGDHQDIWYDNDIKAGDLWRPEIDTALNEAFAVVVIVTSESMKSPYVTYEWSWAVGSGTRLIPLLLKDSYDDIHVRLRDFHCEDCRNGIPDYIIENLKSYRLTPPDTLLLNRLILDAVTPLRILARMSLWLYEYASSGLVDYYSFQNLIEETNRVSEKIGHKLAQIMVDKSHAFTTKQKRRCRELIYKSDTFSKSLKYRSTPNDWRFILDNPDTLSKSEDYRQEHLEPAIQFFSVGVTGGNYRTFDQFLRMLSERKPAEGLSLPYHLQNFFRRYVPKKQSADLIWNSLESIFNNQSKA